MTLLNIKSKDGSNCIASRADNDSFGADRNTIDINPNQILYTRVFNNRIVINFSGRLVSISHTNWNNENTEKFYKEKFLHALKHEDCLVIE